MIKIKNNKDKVEIFVPGRLGIIGELSDLTSEYLLENKKLSPGKVIAVPLNLGVYSETKKDYDFVYQFEGKKIVLPFNEKAIKDALDKNDFYAYVYGSTLYMMRNYKVGGINIKITNMDLPLKKGLSSSAAICLTVVCAFNEIYRLKMDNEQIKEAAYQGEHLANSKCGRLDQAAIINEGLSLINFYHNYTVSTVIHSSSSVYALVVDLNSKKNTKLIMDSFIKAFTNYSKEDQVLLNIIGKNNEVLINQAIKAFENGDVKKIGECLNKAQENLDNASIVCSEFIAPVAHTVFNDKYVKENSYGMKSIGSGGDGSILIICKDIICQNNLYNYIIDKYKMGTIKINI